MSSSLWWTVEPNHFFHCFFFSEPNIDSPLNSHAAELWQNQEAYKTYLLQKYEQDVRSKQSWHPAHWIAAHSRAHQTVFINTTIAPSVANTSTGYCLSLTLMQSMFGSLKCTTFPTLVFQLSNYLQLQAWRFAIRMDFLFWFVLCPNYTTDIICMRWMYDFSLQ